MFILTIYNDFMAISVPPKAKNTPQSLLAQSRLVAATTWMRPTAIDRPSSHKTTTGPHTYHVWKVYCTHGCLYSPCWGLLSMWRVQQCNGNHGCGVFGFIRKVIVSDDCGEMLLLEGSARRRIKTVNGLKNSSDLYLKPQTDYFYTKKVLDYYYLYYII